MTACILVVDDSPIRCQRIEQLFGKAMPQADVRFVNNGHRAIESLPVMTPDLIVADMTSPASNGLELVNQLHAAEQNIPVILITGCGEEHFAIQALLGGASTYVPENELENDLIPTAQNLLAFSRLRQNRRRVVENLTSAEIRYTIENDAKLASTLITHILDQITTMKLLQGLQLTRVGIALQEAISNAIYHGNLELDSNLRQVDETHYYKLAEQRRQESPYRDRRVGIIATLSRHEVRFTIADGGPGFDFKSRINPSAIIDLKRIGGRGLLLIRSFMDQVNFNRRGNELTMVMFSKVSNSSVDPRLHTEPTSDLAAINALISMPSESCLVST